MTIQETLLAFSKKQAGTNEVMRALCSHDGWVAPVAFAYVATKSEQYDRISIWGTESKVPAHKLYLFTDRPAAEAAAGKVQLGPCVSPVAGALLFAGLPGGFKELHVNPASPKEEAWWMGDGALELAQLWGQAVSLEKAIVSGDAQMVERLIAFPGYTGFSLPNGSIATAVGAGGLKNPAMIFTAPDCAEVAVAKFGDQASSLKRFTIGGEQLFRAYPKLGVDGFLVNAFGPGPAKVFDDSICRGLIGSIEARDEVKRLEALAQQES